MKMEKIEISTVLVNSIYKYLYSRPCAETMQMVLALEEAIKEHNQQFAESEQKNVTNSKQSKK